MGRDKALLMRGDETWMVRQARVLREAGCRKVRVAIGQGAAHELPGCDILVDRTSDVGPLEPMAHGLLLLQESHLVVLAVDLPDITTEFVQTLMARCDEERGCVPRTASGWEPLAAVYPRSLETQARDHLVRNILSLRKLVDFGIGANLLLPWDLDAGEQQILLNANHPHEIPEF